MRATEDRVPPTLTLCRGCEQYVHPGTETCPFCSGNVTELAYAYARREAAIAAAADRLRAVLAATKAAAASAPPS